MLDTIKKYAQAFILVAVLAFSAGCYFVGHSNGYAERDTAAKLESFKQQNAWANAMLEEQNDKQKQLTEQGRIYQENLKKSESDAAGIIDGLRKSGNRLRVRVTSCEANVSTGTSGQQFNGTAELSDSDGKFFIGESGRADEWIKRLQETIRILQQQKGGK